MKKILLTLLLALPMSLMAQQKFASFAYADVLQAMPEFKTAQTELETLSNQYKTNLEDMQKEIISKMEKYEKEVNAQTPATIRDRRAQEIQDMQARYQQALQENEKAFGEAQEAKMRPIITKLQDAVNSVAREGNYVYVVDKNAAMGSGLFINDALNEDVTKKVMGKLGISAAAASTPAVVPTK